MGSDYQLDLRVNLKGLLQSNWVHVPGVPLGVDEHGNTALVDHRVQRRIEGHVGTEHTTPFHRAVTDGRLAVESLTGKLHAQVQRSRTAGQGNSILDLCLLCRNTLHLVDVRAHGGHPVGLVGFHHVFQFFSVHRRTSQPDAVLEGANIVFSYIHRSPSIPLFSAHHTASLTKMLT